MPPITDIAGIVQTDSPHVYTVTSNVSVGSGIDDLRNAVFLIRTGGLLKFRAGCTTTFTNCVFVEESTAVFLGEDNFTNTETCRFSGGATCAPIFKGCHWIVTGGVGAAGRCDFDISNDGSAPSFIFDDTGLYSTIKTPLNCFNHFASGAITINGLIIDSANQTALEIVIPPTTSNLILIDNNPGDLTRHFTVLIGLFSGDSVYQVQGLRSRNIALVAFGVTEFPGRIIQLIDPINDIFKSNTMFANEESRGALEVYRTYSVAAFGAVESTNLLDTQLVIASESNSIIYDQVLAAGTFSGQILDYVVPAGTRDVTSQGSYTVTLAKYGFFANRKAVIAQYVSPSGINDGSALMLPDTSISQGVKATVDAYPTINTLDELYDREAAFSIDNPSRISMGVRQISASGETLVFGSTSLVIDSSAVLAFSVTGSTITIKPTSLLLIGSRFRRLAVTSGAITFTQTANYSALNLSTAAASVLFFVIGGTATIDGTFAAGTAVNVTSGQTLTINVPSSQIANLIAGVGVTLQAPQTTITLEGIPSGAEVRILQGSKTIDHESNILGGNYSYSYLYVPGERVKFAITSPGFVPQFFEFELAASSQSLPLTFALDPSYIP